MSPGARALSCEMEAVFGVPCMQLPFSALAPWPRFLPAVWKILKPAVDTGDYFQAAQRLQADAYTRMFNYFHIPDLHGRAAEDGGDAQELGALVELFQARAALFLLFFSLETQAMQGPVGSSRSPAMPPPRPLFPQLQWKEESAGETQGAHVWDTQGRLKSSFANPEYAVLRRWPAFFNSYWSCLESLLASPLYTDWRLSTRSLACRLAQELPVAVDLFNEQLSHAGLKRQDLAAIAGVVEAFLENLSGLLLNLAVARIGLEKGSRPSVTPIAPQNESVSLKPGRVA